MRLVVLINSQLVFGSLLHLKFVLAAVCRGYKHALIALLDRKLGEQIKLLQA